MDADASRSNKLVVNGIKGIGQDRFMCAEIRNGTGQDFFWELQDGTKQNLLLNPALSCLISNRIIPSCPVTCSILN